MVPNTPSTESAIAGKSVAASPEVRFKSLKMLNAAELMQNPNNFVSAISFEPSTDCSVAEVVDLELRLKGTQDVAGVLFWTEEKGRVKIAVTTSLRPALALVEEKSLFVQSLPGAYVDRVSQAPSASLLDTVTQIRDHKLGLKENAGSFVEILGSSYLPNQSASPELEIPLSCQVSAKNAASTILSPANDTFSIGRVTKFLSPQEIYDSYLEGKIRDPRLLHAVLSFNNSRQGNLIDFRKFPEDEIPFSGEFTLPQVFSRDSIILQPSSDVSLSRQARVIREARGNHLESIKAELTLDHNGLEKTISFEAVKPALDFRVQYLFFTRNAKDGKIYVLANKGERQAIYARECTPHPLGIHPDPNSIEGIFYSTSSEKLKENGLPNIIAEHLSHLGIPEQTQLWKISEDETVSPGFNPTRQARIFVPCDAADIRTENLPGNCKHFWIELNSLLAHCDSGAIKDLNLALSASILHSALSTYDAPELEWPNTPFGAELKARFSQIACSGSSLLRLLQDTTEKASIHRILMNYPIYEKLLKRGEAFIGIHPVTLSHNEERNAFASGLAIFAQPEKIDNANYLIQLAHDLRHYAIGELLPFECDNQGQIIKNADGSFRIKKYDQYKEGYLKNEAEAGFFSHYLLPKLIGLARSDSDILGFKPLNHVFETLGIHDQEQAEKLFRTIALQRIIPKEILDHPAYEQDEQIRNAILQILKLGAIFEKHIAILYPLWTKSPHFAQVYLDFSETVHTDLDKYISGFNESLQATLETPEGVNPFQIYVAKFINSEVRVRALKLAYAKQELINLNELEEKTTYSKMIAQIDKTLAVMKNTYQELKTARDTIKTLDFNSTNLNALILTEEFLDKDSLVIDQLYEDALQLLPREIYEKVQGRVLPFFPRLDFGRDPDILEYALRVEAFSKTQK